MRPFTSANSALALSIGLLGLAGGAGAQNPRVPSIQELVHPSPHGGGAFGYGVAAFQDWYAVGAFLQPNPSHPNGGTVTVYRRHGNELRFDQELSVQVPANQANGPLFGQSLALGSRGLVVAAPGQRRPDGRRGLLFAFEHDPQHGWIETQMITDPPLLGSSTFEERGSMVWMEGDHLFVTCRASLPTGRLLYYHHNGVEWRFVSSHQPAGSPTVTSNFGASLDVSLAQGWLIVGARLEEGPGLPQDSGSAYVYRLVGDGTAPYQVVLDQRLLPPAPATSGQFGGDCVVLPRGRVGVLCWNPQNAQMGAHYEYFYIFERGPSGWTLVERWKGQEYHATDGSRVRARGDQILIGFLSWSEPSFGGGSIVTFCEREGFWCVGGVMSPGSAYAGWRFGLGEDFLLAASPVMSVGTPPLQAAGMVRVYPLVDAASCVRATYSATVCTALSTGCSGGGGLPPDPWAGCVNSTGRGGKLIYQGLHYQSFPSGRMLAYDLPPGSVALLLRGFANPAGMSWSPAGAGPLGLGTLCITDVVPRAYPVRVVNAAGMAEWLNPLGQTLNQNWGNVFTYVPVPFQVWYRDVDPAGAPTSNATSAALVTLRRD